MKILALKFVLEANENVPMMCDYENIAFDYGDNAIKAMQLGNVINNTNIEILPIMSVNAGSSGVMKYNCIQYILKEKECNIWKKQSIPAYVSYFLFLYF